ncbi:molybdenum cofactor biosynthesis protein [Defluviimonas sp. 20V17]|uniref:Molybdenum cofactor biosynthesis protein n=1 Tax=Allgaiera indica TaxID=765699 RepID=A0AAN4UNB3_9RHOB|nr:competence/damage-inducible protein A [Allgaiera indica]KDB03573.1 molybdenum cofactor biosynthesis protein [Defluviimonas sp. 20V17]GHD98364.1 molybdenum cofactor biosynthesis protein [Allgaiera indica]SDW48688.1 molybdenum cofactor synthesis domain-containing protein [Allgaiera indica]
MAANPTAAMIVIGDEILSGRTRDSNLHHLAGKLTDHGIDLVEARVIGDRRQTIIDTVNALRARVDHVFTSGGIGPTHDDITADAVAAAFGLTAGIRDDARALLEDYFASRGVEATPARMRMARVPEGAVLIDNPVSVAPGFSLGNVHVMAGVPSVFEAMLQGVLPRLTGGAPVRSRTLRMLRGEGDVAEILEAVAAEYPDLSFGSYPFQQDGRYGTNLVIRGTDEALLNQALFRLESALSEDAA